LVSSRTWEINYCPGSLKPVEEIHETKEVMDLEVIVKDMEMEEEGMEETDEYVKGTYQGVEMYSYLTSCRYSLRRSMWEWTPPSQDYQEPP